MLDYLHSNSVNDDLDINTIMIVPCGVFCFYIILFVFSVFITGYSSKRNEISLRFKLQGGKHALQGERIAIVIPGFHESKNVDT